MRSRGSTHPNSLPVEPGTLYTIEEVAPVLRVAVKTLRRYCREGKLPKAIKVAGGRWLIPGAAVLGLLSGERSG